MIIPTAAEPLRKRFLVTGAAGFVGSHLAEALVARGYEVVGVDAFTSSYPRWYKERNLLRLRLSDRFRLVELDLRTADLDSVLSGVDTVINEAAFPGLPRSWSEVDQYVACNLLAVSRLIDASLRCGVQRFVQASTSSVYGRHAVGDESQPTQPISPYGISKLAAEHLILAHVQTSGLPAVILRYFSIYGPRQRPDMAYHLFVEALRNDQSITVFGNGHQVRSNTFISDCVEGTIAAAEHGQIGEAYNIGGGVPIELHEAIAQIACVLGRRPRIAYAPPRHGDQEITIADTSKAHEAFGYVPRVTPDVGLAAQVNWHLDAAAGDGGGTWTINGSPQMGVPLALAHASE